MDFVRQRRLARLVLVLGVASALLWLARVDYSQKISTDLLDLIPRDERQPELTLARSLATAEHARVVLFALHSPADASATAGDAFMNALQGTGAFAEVRRMDDPEPRSALGRYVYEQRFELLAPGWLAHRHESWLAAGSPGTWSTWLADQVAGDLELFLNQPEAVAFQDLLPGDPLLLVPDLASRLQAFMQTAEAADGDTLVWARTIDDPLNEEGQRRLFSAVEQALAAARAADAGAVLRWASIARFAAENRTRIKAELEGLNVLSLAAVLMIAALGLRRLYSVLHLAPVLACAVIAGWAGVTLTFERVHILVFVVGSLLGGVAIDYGFYLQLQPPLHPDEPYPAKVRRLLRPLLSSALTTVLGFLLLVWSDLPLIRQLGVFISAGLLGALGAALLWFGQLKTAGAGVRRFVEAPLPGRSGALIPVRRLVLGSAAVVAVVGPWQVQWRDDISDLEGLPPEMRAEAAEVRALFGNGPDRTAYMTRGATPAEARAALARFFRAHAERHPDGNLASLGMVVPEPSAWAAVPERLRELAGFDVALRAALVAREFEAEAFDPFFDAWTRWIQSDRPGYEAVVGGLHGALRGPLALTMSLAPEASWFLTITDDPPSDETFAAESTIGLDRMQSLNDLFRRYRRSALLLSSLGLALVGASVLWIYGFRAGWRIFLLPVSACLFAFGVFGLYGHPLNLFHLLGAFLGVCLSHNYAIFTAENARWSDHPAPSVRLSALTTATSFGVLALSGIPVVAALGSTVALIVVAALLMAELAPPGRRLGVRDIPA